jgi:hypothetical protein
VDFCAERIRVGGYLCGFRVSQARGHGYWQEFPVPIVIHRVTGSFQRCLKRDSFSAARYWTIFRRQESD